MTKGYDLPPAMLGAEVTPIPLARFRDEVLELYRPPLRAKGTFIKIRQVLDLVVALAGPGATTAELAPDLVARFVQARPEGESPNSTISLLNSLRAACSYAELRGYLRVSPFRFRKQWVKPSRSTRGHHAREEIARVLELLAHDAATRRGWAGWRAARLYAMVATTAYTGMRRNEVLYLQAEDVDVEGRMVLIVERDGRHAKTAASAQPVPMPDALAAILAGWLARRLDVPTRPAEGPEDCPWLFPGVTLRGPWTGGPYGQRPLDRLKAAGERAGVGGFNFLSLRHSFATHAEFWGLAPAMIQRVLRHTTTRTQWNYRHSDHQNMRDAVRGIGFGGGTGAP